MMGKINKNTLQQLVVALFVFMMIGCSRVPITNRKQTHMISEQRLIEMAKAQYTDFLSKSKVLPDNDARAVRVSTVGKKIQAAVEEFLDRKNLSKRVEGFAWEFKTVEEETVNAWCMPGGKVCVYTGILDLATDDDMLAVIMGHEIAHAIARHGNERMSQQLLASGIGSLTGLSSQDSTESSNIYQKVYMGSATLGILKFSRTHETESDKLGLVFMKLAGYDPNKAIDFWVKMSELGGGAPPQILSTHPSDQQRIADIEDFLMEIDHYLH